jgi:hypothetical protein
MPSKSWRDDLPIHPAAELFPRMAEAELRELGEDIRKNGLRIPLALFNDTAEAEGREYSEKDDQYRLLDGINRLDAMKLVGLEFTLKKGNGRGWWLDILDGEVDCPQPIVVYADPYAFVISANAHRRHLTPGQRRDLIAKVLKATPEKSNRQIAETVKVSHVTVGAVRAELNSTGQIDQFEKTVGKDGKARKPPIPRKSPDKPPPTDDPDYLIALMAELTAQVRTTVDLVERSWSDMVEPLRREIDGIFREVIEGRMEINRPAHLDSPQSCEPNDYPEMPMFLRVSTP